VCIPPLIFFINNIFIDLLQALKTKHDTPKYGLIYHAQLVGGASTRLKGKVSRMLAAKASLGCRYSQRVYIMDHISIKTPNPIFVVTGV
jgi:hypothetical protein